MIEDVPWQEFMSKRFRWTQGEHVSMIGPTGAGKTTLALQILPMRRLMCICANKPRDDTMGRILKDKSMMWVRQERFDPKPGIERIVLWPKASALDTMVTAQRDAFRDALHRIWRVGYWGIFFDEVRYICETLGLRKEVELYWQQARALKISVIAGTQRPAWVPVMMFDQATHLFFWRDNDHYNLKRIGGLGALDSKLVMDTVARLPKRTVLYLNTRDNTMMTTKVVA